MGQKEELERLQAWGRRRNRNADLDILAVRTGKHPGRHTTIDASGFPSREELIEYIHAIHNFVDKWAVYTGFDYPIPVAESDAPSENRVGDQQEEDEMSSGIVEPGEQRQPVKTGNVLQDDHGGQHQLTEPELLDILTNRERMKKYHKHYSSATAREIAGALQRAKARSEWDNLPWGPGIIAEDSKVSVSATTVGRYLKAFRKAGLVEIYGIRLPKTKSNS
ncbi:MAG: hypothetical protein JXA14_24145 [Anaerolineae bacterium]|nr:hypothetical protein [Anaerolineae bacterium]